jgi:AraC-like DNA-binding protein
MAPIAEARGTVNTTILILLILGIIVAGLFSYMNYHPIHTLYKRVRKELALDQSNEMQTLSMAFTEIIAKNEQLINNLEYYKPVLRRFLVNELLAGEISSNTVEVMLEDDSTGLNTFGNRSFVVFLCELPKKITPERTVETWQFIIQTLNEIFGSQIYICEPQKQQGGLLTCIYFIEPSKTDTIFATLEGHFKHMQSAVKKAFGYSLTIGIGKAYSDILSLNHSYSDAFKALRHITKGNDSILFSDGADENDVSEEDVSLYPYLDLERLSTQMKIGNYQNVGNTLAKLFQTIKNSELPIFFARCIIFDLYNTFMKTALIMNVDFSSVVHCTVEELSIEDYGNIEPLEQKMNEMAQSICATIAKKVMEEDEPVKKIIEYVKNHFGEYNFNIANIFDEKGLSVTYVSQLFKKRTGFTISEYLWKIRFERAKYLLLFTDEKLETIVEQIGYVDVSSFIKKFKKSEGITPGEFRKTISKKPVVE